MTSGPPASGGNGPVAIVLKGYPRLSETFIAQEILALEERGLPLQIWSLRRPTERAVHPLHRKIRASLHYLPEYLYQEPLRVLRGALAALRSPHAGRLLATFWRDLKRDFTPNRGRRLGQAFVFARELDPRVRHVHVHYLHTPASVVRYAAILTGRTFSFSAHAKDIWTTPDWEKREKIAASAWGVTCTRAGLVELRRLADVPERVSLVYHGLDLSRFPPPPARGDGDGRDAGAPMRIVTVGRAVAKKGFDDLIAALARLPAGLHWSLVHIGSGELRDALKTQAAQLGLADRITWRGGQPQDEVVAALREADLFVLPCKEGDKGDRDGLPNVIMEAATQALPIVSTRFAGVPEFIEDGVNGLLVAPGDPDGLAAAIAALARDPGRRKALGAEAHARISEAFSFKAGVDVIAEGLGAPRAMALPRAAAG
jgi:glycosyltransferase involved in cell wall biosynthesis